MKVEEKRADGISIMPIAWGVLGLALSCELVIAYWKDRTVASIPFSAQFTDFVGKYIPAVHRFDLIAPQPKFVAFYLAVTSALVVVKAWFFVKWLQSDLFVNYHQLVISPLTYRTASISDFVLASDPQIREAQVQNASQVKQRSLDSRLAWSVAILGFTIFFGFTTWWLLAYKVPTGEATLTHGLSKSEQAIVMGGFGMWVAWSIGSMSVMGSLIAASYCIVKDYIVWAGQFAKEFIRK